MKSTFIYFVKAKLGLDTKTCPFNKIMIGEVVLEVFTKMR